MSSGTLWRKRHADRMLPENRQEAEALYADFGGDDYVDQDCEDKVASGSAQDAFQDGSEAGEDTKDLIHAIAMQSTQQALTMAPTTPKFQRMQLRSRVGAGRAVLTRTCSWYRSSSCQALSTRRSALASRWAMRNNARGRRQIL